jgi:hypothetical protein
LELETIVACGIVTVISAHPSIERGSLFISSIVCLYAVMVIGSGVAEESERKCILSPPPHPSNLPSVPFWVLQTSGKFPRFLFAVPGADLRLGNRWNTSPHDMLTVVGAIAALIAVFYGALFYVVAQRNVVEVDYKLPYDISKFHFIFTFVCALFSQPVIQSGALQTDPKTGPFGFRTLHEPRIPLMVCCRVDLI